jgi:serine/threonine protein phosphatase PrpC
LSDFHSENQDSIFSSLTALVFAVADGVGGYQGAKQASEIAVSIIKDRSIVLDSEKALEECLFEIDQSIRKKARELGYPGMGTTLALAKVQPQKNLITTANAGDSPIFLIKEREDSPITLLYTDDSERFEDPSNLWALNQYLGYGEGLSIHTRIASYEKGDILLLCSDGISDNILGTTNDLSRLKKVVKETRSAKALVQMAMRARLKPDDMSALLVFL